MSPPWTDEHEQLLADAAPPTIADDDLDLLWASVAPGQRPRRHWRAGIAAGAVVAVLGSSGVAAAALWSARQDDGTLAPAAPDYAQVVDEELASVPFPSQAARRDAVAEQVRLERFAGLDERTTVALVRADGAAQAVCAWTQQWVRASAAGDAAGADEAADMVTAAPDWDAVKAVDEAPYRRESEVRVVAEDGTVTWERVRDTSRFHHLAALGDAVGRGDVGEARRALARRGGPCLLPGVG